jgi:uncharacterized protein (TIGR02271 family)
MARLTKLNNTDIDSQYNLNGYDAYDASGDDIGDIDGVLADSQSMTPRYLVIDTGGWFSSKKYVVPMGEVSSVDDNERHVFFKRLTKDTLKSGSFPEYDDEWLENGDDSRFGRFEQDYTRAYAPATTDTAATTRNVAAGTTNNAAYETDYNHEMYRRPEQAGRIQLMEEHLQANKERYQAGQVQLGKRVVEHQETVNVPVREERVVLERHPVSGNAPANAEFGTNETVNVPVMKERVDVEKQAVVREEVGLRKETVERQQPVQANLRREELVVNDGQELLDDNATAGREGPLPTGANRSTMPDQTAGYRPEGSQPFDTAAADVPPERDARRP